MSPKQTLQEREKELQALIGTPAGRVELETLEARYSAATGAMRPLKTSLITWILVHERQNGLIGI